MRHAHDDIKPTDIRRRLRAKGGVVPYTLRQLAEALRRRQRYLTGSKVVLIGFTGHAEAHAKEAGEEIVSSLRRFGARVRTVDVESRDYAGFRIELANALRDADAALIDTDSRFFKALRPREVRALGVDILIPTSLRA